MMSTKIAFRAPPSALSHRTIIARWMLSKLLLGEGRGERPVAVQRTICYVTSSLGHLPKRPAKASASSDSEEQNTTVIHPNIDNQ
jgi:hypothetical protein